MLNWLQGIYIQRNDSNFNWQTILTMVKETWKTKVPSSISSHLKAASLLQHHTALACDHLLDQQTWEPLRLFITQCEVTFYKLALEAILALTVINKWLCMGDN